MRATAQRLIAADRHTCWSAWTDTSRLGQWLAEVCSSGSEHIEAGTKLSLEWPSLLIGIALEATGVNAPNSLAFRARDDSLEGHHQSVELSSDGDYTLVSVVHTGLSTEDEAAGLAAGWSSALALLGLYCERHFERSRDFSLCQRAAQFSFDRAEAFLSAPELLAEWLGADAADEGGTAFRLRFGDQPVTAKVLSSERGRDFLLSIPRRSAAFRVRLLPTSQGTSGDKLVVGELSQYDAPTEDLETFAESSVQRLASLLGAQVGHA